MSRSFLLLCLVLAAVIVACEPSFAVLLGYWSDTRAMGMTHGWLIAGLVVWLLWRERRNTASLESCWWCIVALAIGWAAWLVALRGGVQIVHLALVPVIAWLAVAGAMGRRYAMRYAYALGFFYFAIPLWGDLTPILQSLTIHAVRVMLAATGVPAYFRGETVQIPDGFFHIVGGCSGLHYFLVSLAVGSLYAHVHRDPPGRHLLIVAVAGAIAIVLNWVRVYSVIVSGHLTHMQSFLVRVDHYWFGWALFGVAMGIALTIAGRMLPAAPEATTTGAATFEPLQVPWPSVVVTLVVLLAFGAIGRGAMQPAGNAAIPDLVSVLAPAGIRPQSESDRDPWRPRFVGATAEFRGATPDGRTQVYVAVYETQTQRAKIGYYSNSVTGRWLTTLASTTRNGVSWTQAQDANDSRWLVAAVYVVGDRSFTSARVAQVYYAVRSIARPIPAAVVSVATRCEPDCKDVEAGLAAELTRLRDAMSNELNAPAG